MSFTKSHTHSSGDGNKALNAVMMRKRKYAHIVHVQCFPSHWPTASLATADRFVPVFRPSPSESVGYGSLANTLKQYFSVRAFLKLVVYWKHIRHAPFLGMFYSRM